VSVFHGTEGLTLHFALSTHIFHLLLITQPTNCAHLITCAIGQR